MDNVINFDDAFINAKCKELCELIRQYEHMCLMEIQTQVIMIDQMIEEINNRKIAAGEAYVNDNERTI